jgi:hypothetical protein
MAPSPSAMSAATSWVNVEQCWVSRSSYSTFGCTIFLLCWGLEDVVVGQSRACQPSMNTGQVSAQQRLQMLTSVKYSLVPAYCDVGRHQTKPLLTGPLGKAVCCETWVVMCTAISTGGGEGEQEGVCCWVYAHVQPHLGGPRAVYSA